MDGIDAALVEFESATEFRLLQSGFTPFSSNLKNRIAHTSQNNRELSRNEDSPLHKELAQYYSEAVLNLLHNADVSREAIKAIANHGQTVKHEPNQNPALSLQLGDGQSIAEQTGIRTICQFRQADLAAGGQGAPLMPAFHRAAFGQLDSSFIVNIGGISNITLLDEHLSGYDTGPGNCLMDQWIHAKLDKNYDQDGLWAKTGSINTELLAELLDDSYFAQTAPKSTGTDYFNLAWLSAKNINDLADSVVQRTLLQLTVESIAKEVLKIRKSGAVYVCGGGANNSLLMRCLSERLSNFNVSVTDTLGFPCDQLEAIGFAWLGYCFDHDIKANVPSVTGAKEACVLGQLFVPQN